jgi:hypothetical protein
VDSTRLRSGTRSSRPGSGHARRGRLNSRPTRGRGEMADARVLEARGEIRAGSSPVARISSTDRRAPWGRRGCRGVGPSSPVARISSTDRRAPWGRRGCRGVGPSSPVARIQRQGGATEGAGARHCEATYLRRWPKQPRPATIRLGSGSTRSLRPTPISGGLAMTALLACGRQTARRPERATMPFTMRYRNQSEMRPQASQPGAISRSHRGDVIR